MHKHIYILLVKILARVFPYSRFCLNLGQIIRLALWGKVFIENH